MKENEKNKNENNKEEEKNNNDNNNNSNNVNKDNNESPISGYYEEIYTFEQYISKYGGDIHSDKSKEKYEKYLDNIIKKKYLNFSSSVEILIKGVIINLHPSLNRNVDINNKIIINFSGIEIKLEVSQQQFNFNFGILSIDIGPSDLIYGERVILCPTSYRTNFPNNTYTSNNNLIITPGGNDLNFAKEQEKREAGLNGLLKKFNPNHEEKIKIIDEALNKIKEEPKKYYDNYNIKDYNNEYMNTTLRGKPNNLLNSNSSYYGKNFSALRKSNITSVGRREPNLNKSRNLSFAKTILENYNETDLRLKAQLKKQKNELNISQAINNYNTNNNIRKYTPLNNLRFSNYSNTNLMNSLSNFKLRSTNKFIYKSNRNSINNKNIPPLNLIEIYSNSKIGALKIKYIKFNNSFSLDDFSIQIGTIRLHPFPQYLIDMITIYLDYQKGQNKPQIKRSQIKSIDGGGMDGTKNLLKMRQIFIETLSKIPNKEKTESIKEYMNYLENEINKLLIFDKDIDIKPFFEINYLFSFFPKGIKFYFDYENIECVYYNKMEKVLGKFMISPYNINISISFTKIIANFFGINIEINNLKESKALMEKLMEKCSKMLNDKKDMVELIIEPCYKAIKDELENEGIFDDSIIGNINDLKKSNIKKSVNKLPTVKKRK